MKKSSLVLLLIILFANLSFSEELTIYTEHSGESNFRNKHGEPDGHSVEIVKEIMKRLNETFRIEIVPWKRAYYELENKPNIVLFSTTRTRERENKFKWVGPLNTLKWVLYKKKGNPIELKSLEDAKKLRSIGCYQGDAREQFLLSKGFKNLNSLFGEDSNQRNLRLLSMGRIDLWISSNVGIAQICKEANADISEFEEALVVKQAYLYIAFSKNSSEALIKKWQNTLNEIKKDGTYLKILSRYSTGKYVKIFDNPILDKQ